MIKVGDRVRPRTMAGLELGDVPVNGEYNQKRNVPTVLKGTGIVIKIKDK